MMGPGGPMGPMGPMMGMALLFNFYYFYIKFLISHFVTCRPRSYDEPNGMYLRIIRVNY